LLTQEPEALRTAQGRGFSPQPHRRGDVRQPLIWGDTAASATWRDISSATRQAPYPPWWPRTRGKQLAKLLSCRPWSLEELDEETPVPRKPSSAGVGDPLARNTPAAGLPAAAAKRLLTKAPAFAGNRQA